MHVKSARGIKEITPSNKILNLRVFWSKQRKSIWISAWNLAFSVFISPIWYQYESVNFKALQKSHTKAKDTTDQKRKKKKGRCNVNYIKHLRIYKNQHRNSYVYIITYISNRICFSFHFKYLFLYIDESNMLGTFPLYQLYLQILRNHRHKRPQTQLQQVSDVKG